MNEGTLAGFFCQGAFLGMAIVTGCFFGLYGLLMTWVVQRQTERKLQQSEKPPWPAGQRPCPERSFDFAELLFQFWFNAAGGVVGWIAVWFLWHSRFEEYGWKHFLVFIVGFIGVTGNLPHLSTGIREALGSLAKRISG